MTRHVPSVSPADVRRLQRAGRVIAQKAGRAVPPAKARKPKPPKFIRVEQHGKIVEVWREGESEPFAKAICASERDATEFAIEYRRGAGLPAAPSASTPGLSGLPPSRELLGEPREGIELSATDNPPAVVADSPAVEDLAAGNFSHQLEKEGER